MYIYSKVNDQYYGVGQQMGKYLFWNCQYQSKMIFYVQNSKDIALPMQ